MQTIGMDSYPDATVFDLDNAQFTPALKVVNLDTAVQAVPEFIDVSCQSEPCKPQPKLQSLTFVKNEAISIPVSGCRPIWYGNDLTPTYTVIPMFSFRLSMDLNACMLLMINLTVCRYYCLSWRRCRGSYQGVYGR